MEKSREKTTIKAAKTIIEQLIPQTEQLTKRDIGSWRNAHQIAINAENPNRAYLYNIYDFTTSIDAYVTGIVGRTKREIMQRKYRLVGEDGKEIVEKTNLMEATWFKQFMSLALDAHFYGHSLIELGEVSSFPQIHYQSIRLVPRYNVIPEMGVFVKNRGDEAKKGYSYKDDPFAPWCISVGEERNLGAFLEVTPHAISKKHVTIFWDNFAERFGIPIIYATSDSRDREDRLRTQNMLEKMGSSAWGLFPEGTKLNLVETAKGDAFQVFDKRIERADQQIAIALAGQTMAFDNGSSQSQAEVHLKGYEMIINQLADDLKDVINGELLPRMERHGFPVKGMRFEWNDAYEFTPKEMKDIEEMLLKYYTIDGKHFTEKYGTPITGERFQNNETEKLRFF